MMEMILSIIAILVSIISFICTFYQANKHNTINLKSRFYEKIFDEYLTEKIPEAVLKLNYNNITHRLTDANDIRDILSDLKRDSLFFKYSDIKFYNELVKLINRLENEISDKVNNPEPDNQERCKNILKMVNIVEEIYKYILNYSIK